MASPDSSPSGVPPPSSLSPPPSTPSTPPSQPSTPPSQSSTPPSQSSTPPPPQPSTPTNSVPPTVAQPNANPPDPSSPSPPSTSPNAPPPSNSGSPPVTPPPADSSPPPVPNVPPPSSPPPSPPTASPPTVTPPPPTASPPTVTPPPPTTSPPVSSPPPAEVPPPSPPANPPTPPAANPPTSPPPPGSSTPPPSSSPPPLTPPPTSTPPPPSANPPDSPPPSPPLPSPPADSPPPSAATPPVNSPPPSPTSPPTPPSSQPPQSPPSPPAASPPMRSPPPPSSDSPPPSNRPEPASPPSNIPGPPTPGSQISPPAPPGSDTMVPSSPNLPNDRPTPNSPETASPSRGGIGTGGAIAIGVVAGLLMLGLLGLVGLWIFKRKRKSSGPYDGHVIPASIGSSPRSDGKLLVKTEYPGSSSNFGGGSGSDTPTDQGGYGHSRSWFTYQELYDATSGFSDEKLLGEGGFGRVYKGLLADGRLVAVKQLKVGGGQGEREFKAEVDIISRIHHRHLVSLVGYCIWETKRLLVYDYVANDTLHFHLHGQDRPVMEWATRVKIAVGAARGITYLHEDCHPRIIHRDIKSSNILLDNNFEARVSDFGLAKLAMDAETHVSTRVMGTFGYMAPEYAQSGKLTEKSDVFSYGVVLLELITGRKPVDESQPVGDESLVEWARPLLTHALDTGELEGLVDPRLENNYIESEIFRMIEAAAACVRHSSAKRPRMGLVVRALSMSESGDLSNGLRVGESQLYDSAQQSAEIRWFRRMAFGSQDVSSDFFSNPSQSLGYSGQSRQNVHPSTQHDPRRYSQNTGFRTQSGNNLNFSAERHAAQHNPHLSSQHDLNPNSQNMGFRNQSGNNLNFSAERRGTQHNSHLSTQHEPNRNFQNMGFRNQSGNNLNFSADRHSSQHSPGNWDSSIHREDSGNR